MIRKLHYTLQDIQDYCDSMNETPESFMHSILRGAIKIDEANRLIREYITWKNMSLSQRYEKAYSEDPRCSIHDLHNDVNEIYYQFDEGMVESKECIESCVFLCEAFVKQNKKEK